MGLCGDSTPDEIKESFRYLNKEKTAGEKFLFSKVWDEFIKLYGVKVEYYSHGFNLSSQDNDLYGEDMTEPFLGPQTFPILGEMQSESILFSRFGIQTDADFIGVISIEEFRRKYGTSIEPKAGDVVRLMDTGWTEAEFLPTSNANSESTVKGTNPTVIDYICSLKDLNRICETITFTSTSVSGDLYELEYVPVEEQLHVFVNGIYQRPDVDYDLDGKSVIFTTGAVHASSDNVSTKYAYDPKQTFSVSNTSTRLPFVRCPQLFEITERRYQDFTKGANPLLGHYVWLIHAKRFDYSYEPGIDPECNTNPQVSDETLYGRLSGGDNAAQDPKTYPGGVEGDSNDEWSYGGEDNPYGNY